MNITIDRSKVNSSAAIIVKDAILARSGFYTYAYDEMIARGIEPAEKKAFYTEYRPASVIVSAKDHFKFAIVTKEHPPVITGNVNAVLEGVVGSQIDVVTLDTGEVALKGELAFYTQEGVDYYNSGAKETSAQYHSRVVPSTDGKSDYTMEAIVAVEGLALTHRGRGGKTVSVLDSLISGKKSENIIGDKGMAITNSILSLLPGFNKSTQQDTISSLVMDSLVGYDKLSEEEKKVKVGKVNSFLSSLKDSAEKTILMDTITECFQLSEDVLKSKDTVAKGLDALYARCQDSKVEQLQTVLDSIKDEIGTAKIKDGDDDKKDDKKDKDDDKDDDKDKKVAASKDAGVITADSLKELGETITKNVKDSLSPMIEETVKKVLGLDKQVDTHTADGVLPLLDGQVDASFLADDMFS